MTEEEINLDLYPVHTPIQMRFHDIDMVGHVNNTVYFNYYDLGKTAYFNSLKGKVIDWHRVEAVIAHTDCTFHRPTLFGEPIAVATRCHSIGHKSFIIRQVVYNTENHQYKSWCETVMVCFDPDNQTSCQVPPDWHKLLGEM